MEGVGVTALVTGAYGMLGSWLVKALLERGDAVVVLKRDEVSGSALEIEGTEARCSVVRGDLVEPGVVERAIGEYEVDTVFHLAAQTIVGTANRSPVSTFESNIRGTWTLLEACRLQGVQRTVVAASDKAYGPSDELPYTERHPLAAALPLRRLQGVHRPHRPLVLAHVRPADRGDALRQHLRRRRPQRLAPRPRGDRRRAGRPRAGDPLRRLAAARLPLRRGRRGGLPGDRRRAARRPAGEAFNGGGGEPHSVLEVVDLVCRVAGIDVAPDVRGAGTPHAEIDRQWVDSTKLRELTGWAPRVGLEEGLRRTVDWYRAHPEALAG